MSCFSCPFLRGAALSDLVAPLMGSEDFNLTKKNESS